MKTVSIIVVSVIFLFCCLVTMIMGAIDLSCFTTTYAQTKHQLMIAIPGGLILASCVVIIILCDKEAPSKYK